MAHRPRSWGQEQQDDRRQKDESWEGRERREHGMSYPGGGFGSEHRGYAHSQESQRGYGAHGGDGPQGGGYGAQSSYASHGGYGSQGRGSSEGQRWHAGYGAEGRFRSQGYGTHAGYGSQGGYGPQGDAHWPQSNWPQHGNRRQQRGPKGYKRSDERIREDICERLIHSDFIDSSDVTIEVSAGRVVMEGTVPDRRMKHAIEDMAEATSGVTDVDTKVHVQHSASPGGWSGSGATGSTGTSGNSSFGSAGGLTGQGVSSTAKKD